MLNETKQSHAKLSFQVGIGTLCQGRLISLLFLGHRQFPVPWGSRSTGLNPADNNARASRSLQNRLRSIRRPSQTRNFCKSLETSFEHLAPSSAVLPSSRLRMALFGFADAMRCAISIARMSVRGPKSGRRCHVENHVWNSLRKPFKGI